MLFKYRYTIEGIMASALGKILFDGVTPSSISKNDWLFKSVKRMSILNMLRCYSDGLEPKHLGHKLVKEVIAKKGKRNKKTNRPLLLEEYQVQEYLKKRDEGCFYKDCIQEGCITTMANLSRYLSTLKEHGLVFRDGKKYKITRTALETLLIRGDVAILNNYLSFSQELASVCPLVISDPHMNIYCPPLLFSEYNRSEDVNEKIDRIKKDLKKLLKELSDISVEIYRDVYSELLKEWMEKDRSSDVKIPIIPLIRDKAGSAITVILHSQGVHMKTDILDFIGMDEDLFQKLKKSEIYGEKKEFFNLVSEMFK